MSSGLTGVVSGYGLAGPVSARAVLEPLVQAYGVDATERDGAIVFRMRGADRVTLDAGRLVEEDGPALSLTRERLEQDEVAVRLRFVDAEGGLSAGACALRRKRGGAAGRGRGAAGDGSWAGGAVGGAAGGGAGARAASRRGLRWRRMACGLRLAMWSRWTARTGGSSTVSDGKTIAFEAVRGGRGVLRLC